MNKSINLCKQGYYIAGVYIYRLRFRVDVYFYTRINHVKGEYKFFDTHFVIYLICLKQKHKKDEPLP